jgi:hypothetical protein
MMPPSWSQVRHRVRWLGDGARTISLWFELAALDAAPDAAPWCRRLRARVSTVLALVVAPLVWLLEAIALGLRRRVGVWW